MYIETSSKDLGPGVFVSFERIDIIQISDNTYFYVGHSIPISSTPACTRRFKIQIKMDKN